jgi:hypothetical protein
VGTAKEIDNPGRWTQETSSLGSPPARGYVGIHCIHSFSLMDVSQPAQLVAVREVGDMAYFSVEASAVNVDANIVQL